MTTHETICHDIDAMIAAHVADRELRPDRLANDLFDGYAGDNKIPIPVAYLAREHSKEMIRKRLSVRFDPAERAKAQLDALEEPDFFADLGLQSHYPARPRADAEGNRYYRWVRRADLTTEDIARILKRGRRAAKGINEGCDALFAWAVENGHSAAELKRMMSARKIDGDDGPRMSLN